MVIPFLNIFINLISSADDRLDDGEVVERSFVLGDAPDTFFVCIPTTSLPLQITARATSPIIVLISKYPLSKDALWSSSKDQRVMGTVFTENETQWTFNFERESDATNGGDYWISTFRLEPVPTQVNLSITYTHGMCSFISC
jgi:hypothetical protein